MVDRYLLESGAPDGYLLEDGTGVLNLDGAYHRALFAFAGLRATWHLGEASGLAYDYEGTAHGTVTAATRAVTGPLLEDAKAIQLNGSSAYVRVTDQNALDVASGPFTWIVWFRRRSATGMAAGEYNSLFVKGSAGNLYIEGDQLLVDNDAAELVRSTGTFTDTNWHMAVYTKAAADVAGSHKLYKDGVDVGNVLATTQSFVSNATDLYFGVYHDTTTLFGNFDLAEIALLDVVLTPTEIADLYALATSAGTSAAAGVATGTGAAANASTKVTPTAGVATGTGAALNAAASVKPTAGVATGTGAALGATTSVKATAGVATGTGAAQNATGAVSAQAAAGVAAGTGTASNATTSVAVAAGSGTGTGAATDATAKVAATAGSAAGSGAAQDATVTTGADAVANAGLASGSGAAGDATTSIASTGVLATGTGSAADASASVAATAIAAIGTGAAHDADAQEVADDTALAQEATGTGSALDASTAVAATAIVATGSGAANDATVTTAAETSAAAGVATGTGAAWDATVTTAADAVAAAGTATGVGAAHSATVATSVSAPPATPTGGKVVRHRLRKLDRFGFPEIEGPVPVFHPRVVVHAGLAQGYGIAYDAHTEWDDDETAVLLLLDAA